ncbi:MAG: ribosome silencing factor [Flammeovirgaceae bacterium]|nr:ribosome silencing factor [Flammeovirgaceae bacterium]
MRVNVDQVTSKALSEYISQGMLEMKAIDIQIFDLRAVSHSIADFFVMCSGNSDTHIDSISQMIEKQVFDQAKQKPWHREGYSNKEWMLIDFVDVVAHVFNKEKRAFYDLEKLWADAKISTFED